MGLYAVTSLLVARRTKEIGIRKVNGSTAVEIIKLLSFEFILWYAASFVIACPVAWIALEKWLNNFAYRVKAEWWTFLLAGIIVLTVSLMTVILKSLRAATVNPVEALRYE